MIQTGREDTCERLAQAVKYQKMAFRALLPESAGNHLEVIEQEMKAMLQEMLLNTVMDGMKRKTADRTETEAGEKSGVHKVNID